MTILTPEIDMTTEDGSAEKVGRWTPGPWRIACEGESKHRTLVSANTFGTVGEKNGGIYVALAQGPDNLANARLIAAAPDLFEAVQRALRHAQNIGIDSEGSSYVNTLRAAIAKAEGR